MKFTDERPVTKPYRIGWHARYKPWWRGWRRPWQSENPDLCRWARRGMTPQGAQRAMERDSTYLLRTGRPSPWQRQRSWRRDTFKRLVQHKSAGPEGVQE